MVFLTIALLAIGLTGCSNKSNDQNSTERVITNLIDKSHYFKGAPNDLYLGEALQESFSDQGITAKYRAAFNDGEATYLFFDLIDTDAVLFNKASNDSGFTLNEYDFLEKSGYTDSKQYELISYDVKTRTATICVEYIGLLRNDNITFHIYSMSGNQQMINCSLDDLHLYDLLNKTTGEFVSEEKFMGTGTSFGVIDDHTGQPQTVAVPEFEEGNSDSISRLKTDIMAIPVNDEEGNHVADITNIGWKDGWLHIQLNPENKITWGVNFNLENNKTHALLYSPFNLSFGARADSSELNDYYEYVFYVGAWTKENLDYRIAFKSAAYQGTTLTGDWEIKFAIPDALVKKLETSKTIPINGHELLLQRAVISPVTISLFASRKEVPEDQIGWFSQLNLDDLDLKIIYQDGKKTAIPKQSGYNLVNQKGDMFRITYTTENFDDIAGLEINGTRLPVAE